MARGDPTIFELIQQHEMMHRDTFSIFNLKEKDVARVAREIHDSIPLTSTGLRTFEIDTKSALLGGKIRISKTTIKVRE